MDHLAAATLFNTQSVIKVSKPGAGVNPLFPEAPVPAKLDAALMG
jgi:hypothetical protein